MAVRRDRVTISYRIPERLRARIEDAAKRDGLNLTQEITKCVECRLDVSEEADGAPASAKRHPLNMRTTSEVRARLEAAAKASGRSLAQEVEFRLTRSFDPPPLTEERVRAIVLQEMVAITAGCHGHQMAIPPAEDSRDWLRIAS